MNLTRTQYPITLTGSLKYDGSSITIYYKSDEEMGICSRQLEKKLEQNYVSGYKTQTSETIRKHILFNRETTSIFLASCTSHTMHRFTRALKFKNKI